MPENDASFGLPASTIEALRRVFAGRQGVPCVLVYGSRAKGNYRNGSDIDLALVGETLTGADLMRIENEIDDLDLPSQVDLALFTEIEDPAVRSHIERVGQVFYQAAAVRASS